MAGRGGERSRRGSLPAGREIGPFILPAAVHASRRRFLLLLAAGAGAPAAGLAAWRWGGLAAASRTLYHRLGFPVLPAAPAAPLAPGVRRTLIAAAEALTGAADDSGGVERFVRWRAENVPGYAALYRRFAARCDGWARAAGARSFADLGAGPRHDLLVAHLPAGRLHRVLLHFTDPEALACRHFVSREILVLYAHTTAWRRLGYAEWPGVPRGLDGYVLPPVG